MATNFIQNGDIITVAAPAAVDSGDFVKVGSLFGVAITDAVSGADVAIAVTGVHELPKAAPLVINAGDPVYWSTSNGNFSKTAASNWYVGVAAEGAVSAATTVKVRLNGSMPIAAGA
jgi:predicted RecA/RadA family phage recombinase